MKRIFASLNEPELRRVVVSSLTLGAAVGVFALSFGVASVSAGASVWQTCALSLFVFTGASQFSAMSVVGAGGSLVAAFGGAVLLAARNLFMAWHFLLRQIQWQKVCRVDCSPPIL